MRYVISFIVVFLATLFFDWIGLVIGVIFAFGIGLFGGRRIHVDKSEPFFTNVNQASIEDVHFFELFGFLCKVDGIVSRDEIQGVEVVFNHLGFTDAQRQAAIEGFNRGKQPDYDFEGTLEVIQRLRLSREMGVQLIHLMNVVVANADGGGLVAEERDLLFRIGAAFGLPPQTIAEVLMFRQERTTYDQAHEPADSKSTLERAYETLELQETMTPKEMSRVYRKLRSRYHPDKLARTVSSAQRTRAERRFTEIQRAWDIVRVHHKL